MWLPLTLVLIALLVSPCVFAQEMTAGLQGTVKDPSGASVANATVEVSGPSLITPRKIKTDDAGAYRVTQLPGGVYTLSVTVPGFRTFKQVGIDLAVGRLPSIDVKLEVGAVAETVEVSSDASVVDVTQSKVQVTVSRETLDSLPEGRSFQSMIPFAAGARNEPLQGGTNGFQVDGASNGENVYLIDGVNTTNILTGGVGKSFNMDFVEEVQVKSSSFEAEFGGALGGVVNAVGKRGSNAWHGTLVAYLGTNSLNANSLDRQLRANPATSVNTTTRLDATPEYLSQKKDYNTTVEPGYTVGGALMKNKLWIFSSYIPSISTTRRTTTFTGANPGPRKLTQTTTTHNAYNRLDYGVTSNLRLFGSWNYGYFRTTGTLGTADNNIDGQRNTGASTDPNTLRADAGSVNPLAVYSFGGDWTPTAKLVVSARYGYFFNNTEQRGVPSGNRYLYGTSVSSSTTDLTGAPMPASLYNTTGFANIPSTNSTIYNAYKRKSINVDVSYFLSHFGGTHTLKTGFFYQTQSNDILKSFNGGFIDVFFGSQAYTPVTSTTACDGVKAANLANYGKAACQGLYGYFDVGGNGTVSNTGGSSQTAKAFYIQDNWQVGHGLTLNLGLRMDNEIQPPYDPTRFPTVKFGWGAKIAPRIGGAYDLFHNGKVKIYASYGQFYDIMKMGLAQGSFGSDYWHDCVYALDTTNYNAILPTWPVGGGCPASGPAPGVNVGRFIENVDYRATKADTRDPAIAPDMKPMKQHEYVMGADWAVTPNWSVEARYSRKRLDNTIEDMAITDNLGFYIGNPGSTIADVLHRPVVIPCDPTNGFACSPDSSGNYLTTTPFCAECPKTIPAIRRYDGAEVSLAKRATGKWFGKLSYTYSRLRGNYPGLTNTDPTDGGVSGRLAPNNSRLFDIPTMTYLPSGKIDDGPLPTDRPSTGKAFGYYRLTSKLGTTMLGIIQSAYQGTPLDSCLPVVGTSSACQYAEGRGNFVKLIRNSDGTISKGDVVNNARSDPYIQTDVSLHHAVPVHEGMRMEFELNIINIFNQRSVLGIYEYMIPTSLVNPTRAARFAGDPQTDWGKVMNGYNYMDALNATGAFAGVQNKLTMASRYGMPNSFQTGRTLRLAMRFVF
jgi:hypothetical protein